MADLKRRLIAGTINYVQPEDGWANVHMDKSGREIWDAVEEKAHPIDVKWDITDLLGSPEDDYDEVRCWQTLEHIDPKRTQQTLAGFFRILKPGGVLDIETPNLDAICDAWVNEKYPKEDLLNGIYGTPNHDMFLDSWLMLHVNGFWPERLKGMLEEAGFKVERAEGRDEDGSLQLRYRAIKPDPNAKIPRHGPAAAEHEGAKAALAKAEAAEKAADDEGKSTPKKKPARKAPARKRKSPARKKKS